ncbi:MAG: exosortase/archaeosortase family protein [Candidatus Micrarchaeota archaeon]
MKRRSKTEKRKPRWKGELRKGAKFVVFFAVLFSFAYVVLSFTPLNRFLGLTAGTTSQLVLKAAGVETTLTILQNGNYALESSSFVAELNDACAAIIEIAVLFGIVFASFERKLSERIKGFFFGMVLLLVLNPIRITASILFLHPFVHDVLFRITLVVTIVGFYAVWYYGAEGLKSLKKDAEKALSRR